MATDTDQLTTPFLLTDHRVRAFHVGVERPNHFQHPSRTRPSPPLRNYTITIPSIEHWPTLILQQLKTAFRWVLWSCIQIRDTIQEIRSGGSTEMYYSLPLTSNDSPSEPGSSRPRVSYGKKRHLRPRWVSKRRLGRLACLLCAIAILVTIILLPRRLHPLRNREVWVRYFNHEEPIMVSLPYGQDLYVHDVKKIAMKELDMASSTTHILGNIRLLSPKTGERLWADHTWDNDHERFRSSSDRPIIAVEPRYELFKFLNNTLGCFSGPEVFGDNLQGIKFEPRYHSFNILGHILYVAFAPRHWGISLSNKHILYLREGFQDPLKDELLDPEATWISP